MVVAPDGVREFLGELFGAFPDVTLDIEDAVTDGDTLRGALDAARHVRRPGIVERHRADRRAARARRLSTCWWSRRADRRATTPTSTALTIARQIGLLPPQDSPAEQRMTALFNARTRAAEKLLGKDFGQVAEGVWRAAGQPGAAATSTSSRDGDGVLMFDAGARTMTNARRRGRGAARRADADRARPRPHRPPRHGARLRRAGLCHADEVADAEGRGGLRYWGSLDALRLAQAVHRWLHRRFWDGGPVPIAGTVDEGDDVAGFRSSTSPATPPG